MTEPTAPADDDKNAATAKDGDERRARILDAGLTEFAERGFEKASTNAIAARADVAKGLVFHHFKRKEDLFVAVADDVLRQLMPAFEQTMRETDTDLFSRVQRWTEVKFALMVEDPRRLRFFIGAMTEAPEDVRARTRSHSEQLMRGLGHKLLEGIDTSRLRKGLTADEVLDALWTMSEGLERSIMPALQKTHDGAAVLEKLKARAARLFGVVKAGSYRADVDDDDDVDDDVPR